MEATLDGRADDVETLRAMLGQARVDASRSAELERRNVELEVARAGLKVSMAQLEVATPGAPSSTCRTKAVLQRINRLYAIEAQIRGSSSAERLAGRCEHSRPLVEDLHVSAQT